MELLRSLGEDLGLAWGLSILVISRILAGDVPLARAYLREGLPVARRVGSTYLLGRFLGHGTHAGEPRSVRKQR